MLRELTYLSCCRVQAPAWWTPKSAYVSRLETHRPARTKPRVGGAGRSSASGAFYLQLTLAGWGYLQRPDEKPRRVTAGQAFFATVSPRFRCYVPEESSGWTFCKIIIDHPYLLSRVARIIEAAPPLFEVLPEDALAAHVMRLMRAPVEWEFADRFAAELALFELVLACERKLIKSF